jgi:hypothetical protein
MLPPHSRIQGAVDNQSCGILTIVNVAVLQDVHTFKLTSDPDIDPDTPSINWCAWEINVRCNDWKKRCPDEGLTNEPAAYTDNPVEDVNYLNTINFCPKYFNKLSSCTYVMNLWGKSKRIPEKENL